MIRNRIGCMVGQIVAVALWLGVATSGRAQDFVVTHPDDRADYGGLDGDCYTMIPPNFCTLRAAIQEANALPGQQTIALGAGEYELDIQGADNDNGEAAIGDLDVTDDLIIEGSGASTTILKAFALDDRVFDVAEGANLTLSDLTVSGGTTHDVGGGLRARDGAFVVLARTVFDRNLGIDGGGGVALGGSGDTTLQAYQSEFVVNVGGVGIPEYSIGRGGAIYDFGNSSIHVIDSLLRGNIASWGGAIYSEFGSVTIERSTITSSESEYETFFFGGDSVRIENSTIAHNQSESRGSAVFWLLGSCVGGHATIRNATITDNTAWATILDPLNCFGTIEVRNSVLFNPATETESVGVRSLGHNACPPGGCDFETESATDIIVIDPLLGPLADNGGDTRTRMPLPGSPLRDAGDDANCLALDQRKQDRPQDGDADGVAHCDIGAVEAPEPHGLALPAALAALALQARRRRRHRAQPRQLTARA